MRKEVYQKVAERYKEKYREILGESQDSRHFMDIAGNLVFILTGNAELMNEKNEKELKKTFVQSLKVTKDYFAMLKRFPNFRHGELSEKCHFPDLYEYVSSDEGMAEQERIFGRSPNRIKHYILLAKQELEYGS